MNDYGPNILDIEMRTFDIHVMQYMTIKITWILYTVYSPLYQFTGVAISVHELSLTLQANL